MNDALRLLHLFEDVAFIDDLDYSREGLLPGIGSASNSVDSHHVKRLSKTVKQRFVVYFEHSLCEVDVLLLIIFANLEVLLLKLGLVIEKNFFA